MRIAITGAGGLLGHALIDAVGDKHEIVAAYHSAKILDRRYLEQYPLDLAHEESIRQFVESANADLIVHSAAITDVDLCEREPKLAQLINADATRHIVEAVRHSATRLMYVSTDYVFDGTSGPYAETDPTNPINVYGKTKHEGEIAIHSLEALGTIIRSASFLGTGRTSHPTFVERMLETMKTDPPLRAATDQYSNVTPVTELATGIMQVIEAGASGMWHIAHPQILSRYELAVMVAEQAGLELSRVHGVSYQSLNRVAARPLSGGLKIEKASRGLMLNFIPLHDSIRTIVERA